METAECVNVCACVAAIHIMPMELLNYVRHIYTYTHTTESLPSKMIVSF